MSFRILSEDKNNIFKSANANFNYKRFRKNVVNNILATDMANHFKILKEFDELCIQLKS